MPPTNQPAPPNFRRAGFLLLGLLALLVFHPALQGELLRWDDDVNISANPNIKGLSWEQIKWSITDTKYYSRYQPLAWLTWNAIYAFVGFKPFLYHFFVVALHAANAGLVFLLIERLLRLARCGVGATESAPTLSAFLAAALWACHPMRAETTAWAVELVFVQPLFFLLLSVLAYVRVADADANSGKFYLTSVLCFAASLFTFPIALGGLAVYVALDIFPLRRLCLRPREWFGAAARRVWLEKLPFVMLTLLAAWLNFYARANHISRGRVLPSLEDFGLLSRAMQGFYVWAYYAWKPLLPFDLTPVPMQLCEFNPLSAPFVVSAVFVLGLTTALFVLRERWPVLFLGWVCHLALLVPMLGLSEHPHYPADRYSLLVGVGGAVLLAGLLTKMCRNRLRQQTLAVLMGGLVCVLAFLSYRQTLVWQTNERFFNYVLARLPADAKGDAFRVSINLRLAGYYLDRGEATKSAAAARSAIQINAQLPTAHRMLGSALLQAGELDAARSSLEEAIRLDPSLAGELNDLGVAYAVQGKLAQAAEQFRGVLKFDPTNSSARQNLARAEAAIASGTNSVPSPKP